MSEKAPEKLEVPLAEPPAAPKASSSGAESPRTGRDPDFDDDAEPTTAAPERQPTPSKGTKKVSFQDQEDEPPAPPPKPPRPMSPKAAAEATLSEAFPSMDIKVIRAVLVASGGRVEPAFNALLGMSDPDFVQDLPPPPPRKTHPVNQVDADAVYARQLAAQYGDNSYSGFGGRGQGDPPLPRAQRDGGLKPNELYDGKERSFMDDDLPVIKENLAKGFQDTKNTINKWLKDFQKRLDGDDSDDGHPHPGPSSSSAQQRQNYGPSTSNQLHGIRKAGEPTRRSGDRDHYDADPQVLSDDFGHRLELRDDDSPPTKPPRPLANPDLFKPAPAGGVSAKAADSASPLGLSAGSAAGKTGKSGKWQPLSSVDPTPVEDHDPFSLGDSDEELPDAKKSESVKAGDAVAAKEADSSSKSKTTENAPITSADSK